MKEQEEIWKDVPGYEGLYQVSNLGRVKGLERTVKDSRTNFRTLKERVLKSALNGRGSLTVALYENSKGKTYSVHKLVAMAFLEHIPCGYNLVVDHINHNRTDNRVENLRISTSRANSSHRKNKGSSQYTGVFHDKQRNKWRAYIYTDKKLKYLGTFKKELEAHQAYQEELNKIVV